MLVDWLRFNYIERVRGALEALTAEPDIEPVSSIFDHVVDVLTQKPIKSAPAAYSAMPQAGCMNSNRGNAP